MRLLQICSFYEAYRPRLQRRCADPRSFDSWMQAFISDRYGATQILKPVLDRSAEASLTIADTTLLRCWARNKGMTGRLTDQQIMLAQIEEHRAEVVYDLHPGLITSAIGSSLPGCVRHTIAWHASPLRRLDLSAYDLVVCNFPGLLEQWRLAGAKTAYFFFSHDPEMIRFGQNQDRPIDVSFVGVYTRHHQQRAKLLNAVASLGDRYEIALHLNLDSIFIRVGDSFMGWLPPFRTYRRPAPIRRVTHPPVFGLDLYDLMSRSKIVFNAAIDMAANDRGNMRCFEALGCGALLVTDDGIYPPGMRSGETIAVYRDADHAATLIEEMIEDTPRREALSRNGRDMLARDYSKERQWVTFMDLVEKL